MDFMEEEVLEPVSPTGQYFNSPVLSLSIVSVMETEVPIDDSLAPQLVKDILLPISPRFSSIMVADRDGGRHWRKVEVNLKNHIKTPVFPPRMAEDGLYDECFDQYLTKTAGEHLPQSQPLWEIHIVKYPTRNAAGNIIFKIHHAIGDGYSLMAALLSSLKRADNPSLPLTFPSVKLRSNSDNTHNNLFERLHGIFSSAFATVSDFSWSLMKSSFCEDDKTPIRSGEAGVEFRPFCLSSLTFLLQHIKQIKNNLGLSVNDVITGIVFLGIRLYMEEKEKKGGDASATALVLLNTRMLRSFKSIEDMSKADKKESGWGNRIAFLHVPIPQLSQPLSILAQTRQLIQRKRRSAVVYLNACLLHLAAKLGGPQAGSKFIHTTLCNTSMAITNMIGPVEKISLGNHPIGGIYFMVAGSPQNLMVSIVSYMGKLTLGLVTDKHFVDSDKLKACIQRAFDITLKAASQAAFSD